MKKHQIEFNFNIGNEVYFMDKNIILKGVVSEIDIKVTTIKKANFILNMHNTWTPKYSIVYKITDTKKQNGETCGPSSPYREQSLLFGTKQELIERL